MILSVSRRTDIPCYYSEWFMNRLKAGYVLSRNPYNNAQLSLITISPETVDCIVFWTKDANNIIPSIEEIDKMGYKYYFQFTLTPYDRAVEKNLRDKTDIENTFIELSKQIGKERVLWRYDPIIINDLYDIEYHKNRFTRLCERLAPYMNSVTISFVDTYAKIKTPFIREITAEEMNGLAEYIGKTALEFGLIPKTCCESVDINKFGIEKASCIDKATIETICGCCVSTGRDKNQRPNCGCIESIDIGAYNTCLNGCIYCYANDSPSTTKRRHESHNSKSELLIGTVREDEKIINRKVKSDREIQKNVYSLNQLTINGIDAS